MSIHLFNMLRPLWKRLLTRKGPELLDSLWVTIGNPRKTGSVEFGLRKEED